MRSMRTAAGAVAVLVAVVLGVAVAMPPARADRRSGFADTAGHVFEADIAALAAADVAKGCNPPRNDRFCPDEYVTRGQMAAFLVRALKLEPEEWWFSDTLRHVFRSEIGALAQAGITRGCNPPDNTRFCPDEPVTRGQMAAFLVRALGLKPGKDSFQDTKGHVFQADVAALTSAGITKGCNPPRNDRFCPDDYVTRGQMAAFLRRALGLPDPGESGSSTSSSSASSKPQGTVTSTSRPRPPKPSVPTVPPGPSSTSTTAPSSPTTWPHPPTTKPSSSTTTTKPSPPTTKPPASTTTTKPPSTTTTTKPPASTTTTKPPASTTTTTKPPAWEATYPGQPPPGTILWGAAIGGNGDPLPRHEQPSGTTLAIRRTFFGWHHRTSGYAMRIVSEDVAAGRIPWISFKTPNWADMAAGRHDDEIDYILRELDSVGSPVWLTIWHEPENDLAPGQTPATHVGMNRRVRQRMEALGTKNITLVGILMSWTWDSRSGRNPEDWWAPGIYDVLAVDHYRDGEASLVTSVWRSIRQWAAQKGIDLAVGEWGMRGTNAAAGARVQEWYDEAAGSHADGRGARVVALSAFDSGLNSPTGSWELQGAQLTKFHQLMNDPRSWRLPN